MLTFATYFLLKNPDKLRKLREELDEKLGPDDGDEISLEQLGGVRVSRRCVFHLTLFRLGNGKRIKWLISSHNARNASSCAYSDSERC